MNYFYILIWREKNKVFQFRNFYWGLTLEHIEKNSYYRDISPHHRAFCNTYFEKKIKIKKMTFYSNFIYISSMHPTSRWTRVISSWSNRVIVITMGVVSSLLTTLPESEDESWKWPLPTLFIFFVNFKTQMEKINLTLKHIN